MCCTGSILGSRWNKFEIRGQDQSRADAVGAGAVVAAVVAIGEDEPGVVGAVQVRRAQPPNHGRAALQVGNTLVVGVRVDSRDEVFQLRAVLREILVVGLGPAHLVAAEKEDFAGQAVGPAVDGAAGAGAGPVWDFGLHDGLLDVLVELPQEVCVQVGVNGAVLVVVRVAAVPLFLLPAVLHQQPGPVAALVIKFLVRITLMYN